MSRSRAARRFGVAASSAIKWVARFRASGSAAPGKMGGHKPKTLRGEHAEWLIARSGPEKAPRATLGNRQHPPLAEAPGTYVLE